MIPFKPAQLVFSILQHPHFYGLKKFKPSLVRYGTYINDCCISTTDEIKFIFKNAVNYHLIPIIISQATSDVENALKNNICTLQDVH